MEDTQQVLVNTLGSMLPQRMPFVISQVTEAIKLAEKAENFTRNLEIAIKVAEQVNNYSQGELLYNYTPIIVALLRDVNDGEDINMFDTIDHAVPIALATVKNILDTYPTNTKNVTNLIASSRDDLAVTLVTFANMIKDMEDGKNILNIAYIIMSLNVSNVQYVDGTYRFFCKLLEEISVAEF